MEADTLDPAARNGLAPAGGRATTPLLAAPASVPVHVPMHVPVHVPVSAPADVPPSAVSSACHLQDSPALRRWLAQHCEATDQVAAALVIALREGGAASEPVAHWPAGASTSNPMLQAARAAMQRGRAVDIALTMAAPDADHNRIIALPLRDGAATLGAVALALRCPDSGSAQAQQAALDKACERLGAALAAAAPAPALDMSAQILHLQAVFMRAPVLADAAAAFCAELAAALRCERVSMGLAQGHDIELLALSNGARPEAGHELARLLGATMQEAVDQAARVLYPARVTDALRIVLAHAELHARSAHQLASVPMAHDAGGATAPGGVRAVGAVLAERRGAEPFSAGQLALLEGAAAAVAPLLAMRALAQRPFKARLSDAAQRLLARLQRRDDPLPKVLAGAAVLGAVLATLLPVSYHVGAPARLEGAVQRVVVAPNDGYLQVSHVRPGDTVKAGQVLVEMADQDLLLEQRKWEGALAQHENAFAAALARADRAQFIITQGKAAEARAQLELVRRQLSRSRLLAPIDGVVIKGDLSQALGAPVQRGDTLLTLAPNAQYRIIIDVDERDVALVAPGQRGQLALSALPVDGLAFEVERVTPVAAVRDGRNAFEVQARLLQVPPNLRPGLQGVAKIEAGERSLFWIVSHRALAWLRMAVWGWGW